MKSLIVKIAFIMLITVATGLMFTGCSQDGGDDIGYSVLYFAETGGYIDGEEIQVVKDGDNGKAVKAVPETGYVFSAWSDGVTTAERVDTAVTADKTVTAKFEKIKYSLMYFADDNGTIRGNTEQIAAYGEYSEYVTAVPNEGYEFYKWSDDVTTAVRRERGVKSDVSVTAIFQIKMCLLHYRCTDGGELIGETLQRLAFGETGAAVKAIAKEGYEFSGWTDGVKTAERIDKVMDNINVYASFNRKSYDVIYKTSNHNYGSVHEKSKSFDTNIIEDIVWGASTITVTAKPRKNSKGDNFVFLGWSDGVMTAERTDIITDDLNVTAYFGYEIDYSVNNGVGGHIEGKTEQLLMPDGVSEAVTAVPDDGYVFCGWSDLSIEPTRSGDCIPNGTQWYSYAKYKFIAYFEPTTKTFAYNYGDGVTPTETEITLNRNDIKSANFVVPRRDGYVFCGWYADAVYETRITNEVGRYMYGHAAFSLESDTLYARWRKADEGYDPHRILLVFVDEIDVELYSSIAGENLHAYRKMGALDYMYGKWVRDKLSELLNEWLSDVVKVEVDAYYTIETVNDESKISGDGFKGDVGNIRANQLNEVLALTYNYHNTITFSDLGEDSKYSGGAVTKHAHVNPLAAVWMQAIINHLPLQEWLEGIMNGKINLYWTGMKDILHEFIHTAEIALYPVFDIHDARDCVWATGQLDTVENLYKAYIIGEYVVDGVAYGLPMKYWRHQTKVPINYAYLPVDMRTAGKIIAISEVSLSRDGYVSGEVNYGSEVTVEAVPYSGYRFVKWTDGVTTAVRNDKNIISRMEAYAIFEKTT